MTERSEGIKNTPKRRNLFLSDNQARPLGRAIKKKEKETYKKKKAKSHSIPLVFHCFPIVAMRFHSKTLDPTTRQL